VEVVDFQMIQLSLILGVEVEGKAFQTLLEVVVEDHQVPFVRVLPKEVQWNLKKSFLHSLYVEEGRALRMIFLMNVA